MDQIESPPAALYLSVNPRDSAEDSAKGKISAAHNPDATGRRRRGLNSTFDLHALARDLRGAKERLARANDSLLQAVSSSRSSPPPAVKFVRAGPLAGHKVVVVSPAVKDGEGTLQVMVRVVGAPKNEAIPSSTRKEGPKANVPRMGDLALVRDTALTLDLDKYKEVLVHEMQRVRVGTFNLGYCGTHVKTEKRATKVANIARAVRLSKMDIVAVQELPFEIKEEKSSYGVKQVWLGWICDLCKSIIPKTGSPYCKKGGDLDKGCLCARGLRELLRQETGDSWELVHQEWKNEWKEGEHPSESLGFIFNSARVRLVGDSDESSAGQFTNGRPEPRIRGAACEFRYRPMIRSFVVGDLHLLLCNVHIKPKKYAGRATPSKPAKPADDPADEVRLLGEVIRIARTAYGQQIEGMLILGDFNMCAVCARTKNGCGNTADGEATWHAVAHEGWYACGPGSLREPLLPHKREGAHMYTNVTNTMCYDNILAPGALKQKLVKKPLGHGDVCPALGGGSSVYRARDGEASLIRLDRLYKRLEGTDTYATTITHCSPLAIAG